MFNPFRLLSALKKDKTSKQKQVFKLWEELEACEQAYKHKKSLGDKLLDQASEIDNIQLPFAEKMVKKEIYLNAARDNLDKADYYNQQITELSAKLRLAIEDARC